jgi:hypothetical protein
LVERESGREGRFVGFDSTVRRRFNTALAWWVWNRDEGMSVRLTEIPGAIVESAIGGADHPYGGEELKRELVAGCLIDNAAGGAHYRHRSIQEFLVAEYFQQTLIEGSERDRCQAFDLFMKHSNPEIADFVVSRLQTQAWPDDLVKQLVSGLLSSQVPHIPRHVLALVSKAASERMRLLSDDREPWAPPAPLTSARAFVLGHAIRTRSPDLLLEPVSLAIDTKNLGDAHKAAGEVWDAAVLVWGHALRQADEKLDHHLLTFLAQCFCSQSSETAPGGVDTSFGALLACMAVEKYEGSLHIELNLELLTRIFEERIATSFGTDQKAGRRRVLVRVEINRLLDYVTRIGWNAQTVKAVGDYLKERKYQPFRDTAVLQRHTRSQHST